jgi:hypothetical protein
VKVKKGIGGKKGKFIRLNSTRKTLKIWSALRQYFPTNKVEIYIDKENELLGLKPVEQDGFTFYDGLVSCSELYEKYSIESGLYPVEWSEKHGMLIAKIRFMRESKPNNDC